ncbi:bicyclomycin resistance protein [Xaviernesmea oryzae]|uniref:Bicyclomycin resistance protein n=1 Tax=Xaviernesmea oryzae TaxID=464029 RepID=A0A1Q9AWS4_9HYPH|nr:multidrug effflux MFS transporter [Xaviernesmea oryzae]OLP59913.1 bicyclomycin resistance protein [Xaviernesmea oryzae]SEK45542.1 MFS transporter, DHA1 family, bicyclomycin/chloramphenicol resistance protein [Xaviernesmea oryzae]
MTAQTKSGPAVDEGSARIGLGFSEFVITMALMTASISFAIDSMLPALPHIASALHVEKENDAQLVIAVFFFGFGLSQLFFGSLADAFGRRRVLLAGLAIFTVAMLGAAWTESFTALLILRFCQGIGGAAVRICTTAITRDCFGGREMARVMSYIMIVFMLVPIIAPSLGQAVLFFGDWSWIFVLLGGVGAILFLWAALRMRESLPQAERQPLSLASVVSGFSTVLTNRITCGYMIALTLFTGVICAFIVTVQQVFGTVYGLGDWLPLAFAGTGSGIALANFGNGQFVRRFGMRRISHAGMIGFTILAALIFLLSLGGKPPFLITYLGLTLLLMMFAVVATNFTAISLEPMGHIAGTATAITGFVSTTGGAILGGTIGQMFNGTVQPLFGGFAVFGAVSLVAVLWAERGQLFTHPGDETALDPAAGHM